MFLAVILALFCWRGCGWMVPWMTFATSLTVELLSERLARDDSYYQVHGLPFALALALSGLLNALAFWSAYKELWLEEDEQSRLPRFVQGVVVPLQRPGWFDHSFLFINQGVWALFLWGGAVWALIARGL